MSLETCEDQSHEDTADQQRRLPSITEGQVERQSQALRKSQRSTEKEATDYIQELSMSNRQTVKKVEHMVRAQQNEITLLNSRILNLNRQIDRQRSYFTSREHVLKGMYEDEISLLESYRGHSSACDKSDAGTQMEQPAPKSDASTSTLVRRKFDVACGTLSGNSVDTGVQSEGLRIDTHLDDSSEADYQTCADLTPLNLASTKLKKRLTEAATEDEAFEEAERLHNKTQQLYARLNILLSQFHSCDPDDLRTRKERMISRVRSDSRIKLDATCSTVPCNRRKVGNKVVNNQASRKIPQLQYVNMERQFQPSRSQPDIGSRIHEQVRRLRNPTSDMTVNSDLSTLRTVTDKHVPMHGR